MHLDTNQILCTKIKAVRLLTFKTFRLGQRGSKGYVGRKATLSFKDPKGLDNQVWLHV